ncbi:hypothetical protein VST7929_01644 [Vibrio stylophorae]|uniref:Uncharacterized protein n=1 Tax=Vibrio stylophorae TaxID=659351 RepID=A0ABM8ZTX8_9VIBR|nr:hypothetical protein [Vibrio stylophorae]CAH0533769.1 hypothetical protein VST7929_01644 [Vibrio stylophorae]
MKYLPAMLRISAAFFVLWSILLPMMVYWDGLGLISSKLEELILIAGIPLFVLFFVLGLSMLAINASLTDAQKNQQAKPLQVSWRWILAAVLLLVTSLWGYSLWQRHQLEASAQAAAQKMMQTHQSIMTIWSKTTVTVEKMPQLSRELQTFATISTGYYGVALYYPVVIDQQATWITVNPYLMNQEFNQENPLRMAHLMTATPRAAATYFQQHREQGGLQPYVEIGEHTVTFYLPIAEHAGAGLLQIDVASHALLEEGA